MMLLFKLQFQFFIIHYYYYLEKQILITCIKRQVNLTVVETNVFNIYTSFVIFF